MFTWPENILPLPSFNLSVDTEYANVRSKMDSGRVRQRPRFTQNLELADLQFELEKGEYAYFKAFWDHIINRGNDWFKMRLPLADNEYLTLAEIRFVSDYKASHRPVGNWDVSATIEFRRPTNIGAEVIAANVIFGDDAIKIVAIFGNLQQVFPYDWQR